MFLYGGLNAFPSGLDAFPMFLYGGLDAFPMFLYGGLDAFPSSLDAKHLYLS